MARPLLRCPGDTGMNPHGGGGPEPARGHLWLASALVAAWVLTVAAQDAGRDYPQWRGVNRDGAASAFAEPENWPQAADPADGRLTWERVTPRPLIVAEYRLRVRPAKWQRGDDSPRRGQRPGTLAHGLPGAVRTGRVGGCARRGPQGHAALPQRPAVHTRHDRHRLRHRRGHRTARVADSGRRGASHLRHVGLAGR